MAIRRIARAMIAAAVAAPLFPLGSGGAEPTSDDFRLENRVFRGDVEQTNGRSTTIFHAGVVYDYLEQPAETTVFQRSQGRFILLDADRRLRTELTTTEVSAFTDQLQKRAVTHRDPLIRFMASPLFDESLEPSTGHLVLASPQMTYRVALAPAGSGSTAEQYREFTDWYARLNTVLSPGARPPLARLMLNAALARHEATAREVRLTISTAESRQVVLRSEHRLVRPLAAADLERIEETWRSMESYKPVGFEQYRKATARP